MPGKRLSMRKIKEILRLKYDCRLSGQAIASSCGVGRTTVREYVRRAAQAGLSWPLPESLTDSELEQLLFPPAVPIPASERCLPDWPEKASMIGPVLAGDGNRCLQWKHSGVAWPVNGGVKVYRVAVEKCTTWAQS